MVMVMRTIANKVGTIQVEGNAFYFLQPLSTFKTDQMDQIQQAYEKRMATLTEQPFYLTAKDLTFQSGQVQFEYDLTGFKAFDHLKSLYFEDKLPYYLSLVRMAKDSSVTVLWQKENFVIDPEEQLVKAAIIENEELILQNPKSREDAVKELIIISLTSLNRVLGRPRRNDFFEQSEDVIRFAETIFLRLKTLEEMESYLLGIQEEVNERKRLEAEELAQQEADKGRFSFSLGNLVKGRKEALAKTTPQLTLAKSEGKQPKKSVAAKDSNKRFLLGTAGILAAAVLLNIFLTNANENAQATDAGKTEVSEEISLEEVYRQGLLGDDMAVIEALEAIGQDSLKEKDKEVLATLYMENGDYTKAIEADPELTSEVAAKLMEEDKVDELQALEASLKETSPEVAFELAAASEDWQTVIDLRNQVELTEERIPTIVSAFIQTGDLQTAKAFVNEKAPENEEVLDRLLEVEKQQNELEALKTEKAEKQKLIDTDTDEKKIKAAKERIKEIDQQITELEKGIEVIKGG